MINEWLIQPVFFDRMCIATKVTPIVNINGKCYVWKVESTIACLTGYSSFASHEYHLAQNIGGVKLGKNHSVCAFPKENFDELSNF